MLTKKAGILYHPMIPATKVKAQELENFLISEGIKVWSCSAWEKEKAVAFLDSTDLILTAGGDGTILRAAQVVIETQIPIIGVNLGNLGFLTELKTNEAASLLPRLLNGQGWLDERAMLEAELIPGDSNNQTPAIFYALNDIVLARGSIARLIKVTASIDDETLANYRADGVILATATGSTGYSMAAGGPILYPQSQDFVIIPIVPHLSPSHSLVISSSSHVKLQLSTTNQSTLSVDGHINIPVGNGSVVKVKKSIRKTRFLRIHPPNNFFKTLEEKLERKK
jgi:NAD+ kinase